MSNGFAKISKPLASVLLKSVSATALMLMLCFCLAMASTPHAYAATATPSQLASGCAVMNVQLHGSEPATVTCAVKQTSGVHPNIVVTSCGGDPDFLMISSGTYWCFSGTGYISTGSVGVSGWYNVTYLTAFHCSWGWIRAYTSAGGSNPSWNDGGVYSGVQPPYSDVTQVDITAIDC